MLLAHHDASLRTATFTLEDRWLLWPRARLYADRVELTGWSLGERYRRSIPLASVEEAEATGRHLVLHLADGSSVQIEMDTPEQWASAIATYRDVREGTEEEH